MTALRLLMVVLAVFSSSLLATAPAYALADTGPATLRAMDAHAECCPDSAEHAPGCHAVLALLPTAEGDDAAPDRDGTPAFETTALPTGILPAGLLDPPRAL